MKRLPLLVLTLSGLLASPLIHAHGEEHMKHQAMDMSMPMEQMPWGIAGEAGKVDRSIDIRMSDQMRFIPDRLQVRQGESIRLVIHNDGKTQHEFVLGNRADLDKHAEMMARFPGMEHDEPYMAHVAPGQTGEIIWTFNRAGEFDFACLIAGHYQAGMTGSIEVLAK